MDNHALICCGDHLSSSFASTMARNTGLSASLAALGRRALTEALFSARRAW